MKPSLASFLLLPSAALLASRPSAQCASPEPANVESIGLATVGQAGPPELTLLGAPIVDSPFALRVTGARPGASGFLVLGLLDVPVPAECCGAVLHPGGPAQILAFATDVAGDSPPLAWTSKLSAAACGLDVYVQAVVLDADALGGVAFTRAARVRAGAQASSSLFGPSIPAGPQLGGTAPLLGDADGDQVADLVFGQGTNLAFAHGNGDGTFLAPRHTATGLQADMVLLADLDQDGDADAVAGTTTPFSAPVVAAALLGDGSGSFTAAPIALPQQLADLAVGDVDGDGVADLVTAHLDGAATSTGFTQVLHGNGDGSFQVPVPAWHGIAARELRLADVDLDGDLDVLTGTRADQGGPELEAALGVQLGAGDGTFGALATFDLPTAGTGEPLASLEVADLDLDGTLDAAGVVSGPQPALVSLLGDGAGAYAAALPTWLTDASTVQLRDFDGDVLPDALVAGLLTGFLSLHAGFGDGSFAPAETFSGPFFGATTAVGDVDGDLDPDVVQTSLLLHAAVTFELHLVE
jgi:hypothetical protein